MKLIFDAELTIPAINEAVNPINAKTCLFIQEHVKCSVMQNQSGESGCMYRCVFATFELPIFF